MLSYLHFARVAGNNDLKTSIPVEVSLQRQHHNLRQCRDLKCVSQQCAGHSDPTARQLSRGVMPASSPQRGMAAHHVVEVWKHPHPGENTCIRHRGSTHRIHACSLADTKCCSGQQISKLCAPGLPEIECSFMLDAEVDACHGEHENAHIPLVHTGMCHWLPRLQSCLHCNPTSSLGQPEISQCSGAIDNQHKKRHFILGIVLQLVVDRGALRR